MREREREIDKLRDDYNGVLFIIGQKVSLKDNHRGVIDKILAIQDRHKTNFRPYVVVWSKSFVLFVCMRKTCIQTHIS